MITEATLAKESLDNVYNKLNIYINGNDNIDPNVIVIGLEHINYIYNIIGIENETISTEDIDEIKISLEGITDKLKMIGKALIEAIIKLIKKIKKFLKKIYNLIFNKAKKADKTYEEAKEEANNKYNEYVNDVEEVINYSINVTEENIPPEPEKDTNTTVNVTSKMDEIMERFEKFEAEMYIDDNKKYVIRKIFENYKKRLIELSPNVIVDKNGDVDVLIIVDRIYDSLTKTIPDFLEMVLISVKRDYRTLSDFNYLNKIINHDKDGNSVITLTNAIGEYKIILNEYNIGDKSALAFQNIDTDNTRYIKEAEKYIDNIKFPKYSDVLLHGIKLDFEKETYKIQKTIDTIIEYTEALVIFDKLKTIGETIEKRKRKPELFDDSLRKYWEQYRLDDVYGEYTFEKIETYYINESKSAKILILTMGEVSKAINKMCDLGILLFETATLKKLKEFKNIKNLKKLKEFKV